MTTITISDRALALAVLFVLYLLASGHPKRRERKVLDLNSHKRAA